MKLRLYEVVRKRPHMPFFIFSSERYRVEQMLKRKKIKFERIKFIRIL